MDPILASPIDKARIGLDQISHAVNKTLALDHFHEWVGKGMTALITIAIFVPLLKISVMILLRILRHRMSMQNAIFLTRWLWRLGLVIVTLSVLKQLGLDLVAIMGAAGIAGIAVGFAAQNSLSNVISGFFLMGERSINIDDFIEINGQKGTVEEVGVLSVSLRTVDNKQVRIPNETILKGTMINYTRYPIRRFDFTVGVSYAEDLDKVLRVLRKVLLANVHCLDEPEALIVFTGFGNSSCDFLVGAWCRRQDYDALRNSISKEIKEAFDREGIEIPFPYTTLTGGKASAPFEVKIVQDESTEK